MMMVMMPLNHIARPGKRRLVLEADRLRPTIDVDRATFRETEASKIAVPVRQAEQRLLALAHDNDIDRQLLQRSLRRRRAMRTNGKERRRKIAHGQCELLRHPQF